MLVSSSVDGEVVIWSLDLSKKNSSATPELKRIPSTISLKPQSECIPFCSIIVEDGSPISVEVSPNMKCILVVCSDKWILYTASNPRVLFKVASPEGMQILGGSFVNYNRVIIWGKEKAYVYCLPDQDSIPIASFFPPVENDDILTHPKRGQVSFFKKKPKKT